MLFGLMLAAVTCCGQNANTGTLPGPAEPVQPVQYLSADSNTVELEQKAPLDTDVVFAVVNPPGLQGPVISDSQGNIYASCNSGVLLYAFATMAMKAGANTITVQNARAICVVEFGNLIPVSS